MESQEAGTSRISLISKFVRDALRRRLSKFLANQLIEIQGSLARPEVTLKDLQLREDALDMYVLPVSVTPQSKVGILKASFPLTSFTTKPVILELSNIRIFAVPNEVNWTDFGSNKEKPKKLEEWKEEQKSEFRDMEKKGWIANLKQKVLNNLKQTIRNLEIVYLDKMSLGYPCFVRIYVGRLEMETTNSNWQVEFSNDQNATHRVITITEFSIALVADRYEDSGDFQNMHDYYKNIRLSERHYLLKPCKITIKHRLNHTDPLIDAWQSIRVETAGLEVSLNEMQYQYIKHLLNYINFKQSYKKYQIAKPPGTVMEHPQAWWNYLISAAKHDIQANFKVLYENKERMERYIDLFKRNQDIIHSPWLQQLKKAELEELRQLEDDLPVNDILFYRSVALNHLRIEAMQYVRAKGNVKGITHLGDLWDYYLNDFESLLGDPNQQVAREEEVEMNREEKQELKILMSMDKQQALKSLLSGKSSTAHDQTFTIDFAIKSLIFYLQKTDENVLEDYEFFDRKRCSCKVCTMKPKDKWASRMAKAGKFGENLLAYQKGHKRVGFPGLPPEKDEDSDEDDGKKIVSRSLLRQADSDIDGEKSVDYVVEIEKITHDDPDPRLLGEHTLLVLNFKQIAGKVGVLRNGRLWTEDSTGITIEQIYIWDPISLRDASLRRNFFDAYKLKNLLDDLIEFNVNDDPAFYSLKHFMRLCGFLAVFEFYVHHKEVTPTADSKGIIVGKTTHRYCSCGHSYSHETLFNIAFHDQSSQCFIHMPDEDRPSDLGEMATMAGAVRDQFIENVLPFFVRRCARWIFPSVIRRFMPEEAKGSGRRGERRVNREQDAPPAQFQASFEFLGEKNPIEVTFGQGPQRPQHGDEKKRSHLLISLSSPSMVLSNTTMAALVQWLDPEDIDLGVFAKESLTATFKERVKRMRPELYMVSEFHKQSQKDVRHLYNYMQDLVKSSLELTTHVNISSLRISLLDEKSIGKYQSPPIIVADLTTVNVTIKNRAEASDSESVSTQRPRHGMTKDLKFYKVINLEIRSVVLKSMEKLLINTSVKLALCQCLVQHHPELPDLVVDFHIPELALEVSTAMLPLISFIDNLNLDSISRLSRQAEESAERRSDASLGYESLFKIDLKKTKNLLKKLNKDHFKHKTPCGHCQIMYTKHRKLIYFSIGCVTPTHGLSISMMPDGAIVPSITVKIPMVVFTFQEKCFLKTASLLMSEVSLEGASDEAIELRVHNSKNSVFPIIPAKVFEQLPYLREALSVNKHYEDDEAAPYRGVSMQEILVMRQHIHPDVYTEKEWDYREGEYLRNKQQKKAAAHPLHILERRQMSLRESDIRYSDADYVYVRVNELRIRVGKPLQDSRLLAGVLGVLSLLDTSKRITPPPSLSTVAKKRGKLTIIAHVALIQFECEHREAQLSVSLKNLSFERRPHRGHESPSLESRKNVETIIMEANCLKLSIKTGLEKEEEQGAQRILSLSGAMDKVSGTYEFNKEHSMIFNRGVFRLSSFYISDTSQPTEVLLFAVPSFIRGEAVPKPSGNSVTANYDELHSGPKITIEIEPVAILLKAETIIGLKLFFEKIAKFAHFASPLDPDRMVREDQLPIPLMEETVPVEVRMKSIQGMLGALGCNFLTVELKEFTILRKGEGLYTGSVNDLGLTTKLKEYPSVVTKTTDGHMFVFTLKQLENTLELTSHGMHLWFLNRLIEEILGYLKMINSKDETDGEKEDRLSFDFNFRNATLYLPNSSEKRDMLVLQFENIQVTNGKESVCVKRPARLKSSAQHYKKQEFDVSLLADQEGEYLCDFLRFRGTNAICLLHCNNRDQRFGVVPSTVVSILSPPNSPITDEWDLDSQISVRLDNPLLVPSLSDFVHLIDIIEANIDEKTDLFEKTVKAENTQFDIRIEIGRVDVDKWINTPVSAPRREVDKWISTPVSAPRREVEKEKQAEDIIPDIPSLNVVQTLSSSPLIMPIAEIEIASEPPSDPEEYKSKDEISDLLNVLG